MTIDFNCPMCGKNLKSSNENAGKSARCKHCGEGFTIPFPVFGKDTKTLPEKVSDMPIGKGVFHTLGLIWANQGLREFFAGLRPVVAVIMVLIYWAAANSYYNWEFRYSEADNEHQVEAVLLHLTMGSLTLLIVTPKKWKWRTKFLVVFSLVGMMIYLQTNTGSYSVWRENSSGDSITEKRHRSNDKPFYRTITQESPWLSVEGPLADTGSMHGRWEVHSIGDPTSVEWYWHGEIVTEAEFFRLEAGR